VKKSPKVKKSQERRFRFTDTDREQIKADLKRRFKPFLESLSANRDRFKKSLNHGFPMLGPDWRLQDEGDDRHIVVFPLRVDVDLRLVRGVRGKKPGALDILFPDEAKVLKENIIAYITRCKAERRKAHQHADSHFRVENLVSHVWPFFGAGWIAGQALFNILTPDAKSKERWEKNLRRGSIDKFRVPPDTAAQVVSDLLNEEFDVTMRANTLKKRFEKMPRP
jgi:hypothetical protein